MIFFEKYNEFWFLGLWKFLLKYKKFFKLKARKFHFLKYKKLFILNISFIFYLLSLNIRSFI